jgi:Acetyl xylan esterase (AXE1)
MIRLLLLFLGLIFNNCPGYSTFPGNQSNSGNGKANNLPRVLPENHSDLVSAKLRFEAGLKFGINKLPDNLKDWEIYRRQLKNEILKKAGVNVDHKLSLNIKETGKIQMKGYSVRNIAFQTEPGIYATANLYIPDGTGPFPAVINMPGHWNKAKIDTTGPQAVGHSLALNGYVCLTIDPWGSGERTTIHGIFEDHGDENNLGSALMDIGKPLIGFEISDNMRGVDLLCSLPYVDSLNIGATGASGGGNQTMWLASLDERIKAAMTVVSAGTFESHIMGSPCICEVMPDALNFTEEAGILALVAPRALKMCNHKKDDIPAFLPSEMIRSYKNAKPVFKMYGVENNIAYQLFDLPHGYWAEDREALLGWFDLHLKRTGTGAARKEIPFKQLAEEKLMVFSQGQRDASVTGTVGYCIEQGNKLRSAFLSSGYIDAESKRNELGNILGLSGKSDLRNVYEFAKTDGWDRVALETSDNKLIPVLIHTPSTSSNEFVVITDPDGKERIPSVLINEYVNSGKGIAVIDLSGTGEASATSIIFSYKIGKLRAVSRSELWFGKTIIGEWVQELNTVIQFVNSRYKASRVTIDGSKETGLAGLFLSALEHNVDNIIMREAPVTYLFDTRKGIEFFSMGVHIPGILKWGDISLAAALSGKNLQFINPVSMSGNPITGEKLSAAETEFEKIRTLCHQSGITVFK